MLQSIIRFSSIWWIKEAFHPNTYSMNLFCVKSRRSSLIYTFSSVSVCVWFVVSGTGSRAVTSVARGPSASPRSPPTKRRESLWTRWITSFWSERRASWCEWEHFPPDQHQFLSFLFTLSQTFSLFWRRNKNYKIKPSLPKVNVPLSLYLKAVLCVLYILIQYFYHVNTPADACKHSHMISHIILSHECVLVCLQHLLDVKSLKYLSCLTLHDRITKSLLHLHKKKKPPSISAQFNVRILLCCVLNQCVVSEAWELNYSLVSVMQVSLNKLMETLGQSEPYFVKCIRSNAEKVNFVSYFCCCVTRFRCAVWFSSFFRSFLCASTTRWCWDSCGTLGCWRRWGYGSPDTASNTAFRWENTHEHVSVALYTILIVSEQLYSDKQENDAKFINYETLKQI